MNWLFGASAPPAQPPAAAAPAPQQQLVAEGCTAGVSLDVLTVREGESLESAKLATKIPKDTQLRILEVRGRRALVRTTTGLQGWVSLHQPSGTPLVGKADAPAAAAAPPQPAQQQQVDFAALAQRVVAIYDDNGDGALDCQEMSAHEKDIGRTAPSPQQYEVTCKGQGIDPKQGFSAVLLAGLLSRASNEQQAAVATALAVREREMRTFQSMLACPVQLAGYLAQEVAGWLSSGPVKRWLRLDGCKLTVSADPVQAPTDTLTFTASTKIEGGKTADAYHLKIANDGQSTVFRCYSKADMDLWSAFLSLAVAQAAKEKRTGLALRTHICAMLASAPPSVPFFTGLPEVAAPPRLHGYAVSCTYWSMLGPNWKRRYCTLHDGWWAIRESKEDSAGLVVMSLRYAVIAPDPSQPFAFSVTCEHTTFAPVMLWCDGADEHSMWRASFEREVSRAKGLGRLSWQVVKQQDAGTSNALIVGLAGEPSFDALSLAEGKALVQRDEEDDVKLQKGIDYSISRGVLEKIKPPKVNVIDVAGKSVKEVCASISSKLPGEKGCVVVLQGMSGTGKSTTTKSMLSLLPRSVGWSNGNVFRSITLLAAAHCDKAGLSLKTDAEKALTTDNIAEWMKMLSFEATGAKYTIRIRGLGYDHTVDEIATTLLQEPRVAHNIPTVAEKTQGEVIKFAAAALKRMEADGRNVVLEGRAATVQYVPTPYRFELVLRDTALLGQRRAAQRVMGALAKQFGKEAATPDEGQIRAAALAFCKQETK